MKRACLFVALAVVAVAFCLSSTASAHCGWRNYRSFSGCGSYGGYGGYSGLSCGSYGGYGGCTSYAPIYDALVRLTQSWVMRGFHRNPI